MPMVFKDSIRYLRHGQAECLRYLYRHFTIKNTIKTTLGYCLHGIIELVKLPNASFRSMEPIDKKKKIGMSSTVRRCG